VGLLATAAPMVTVGQVEVVAASPAA